MKKPFISVIVPVYNSQDTLNKCIESLLEQTYPKDRYEIIMVDNGSKDNSKKTIKKYPVTIIEEISIKSSYAARNTGIKASKGEILAFTDADCIADKEWLEKGGKALTKEEKCGLVGGKIDMFFKNPVRPTAAELFDKSTGFRQKKYIKRYHFAATANLFTLKKVVDQVGILKSSLKSGGDLEWGRRIFGAGYKQIYENNAIVMHPARYTIKKIIQKHRRVIGGLHDEKKGKPYSLKEFLIDLKDDWPQPDDFLEIFKDEKLSSLIQKIRVLGVMMMVKIARIFERSKLWFTTKSI